MVRKIQKKILKISQKQTNHKRLLMSSGIIKVLGMKPDKLTYKPGKPVTETLPDVAIASFRV